MRKSLLPTVQVFILFLSVLTSTTRLSAQAASATWALTSNGNVAVTGAVTGNAIVGGSGIGGLSYNANGVSSNSWATGNNRNTTNYYEYKVTPTAGNMLLVNALSFSYNTSGSTWEGAVFYSLDGFATETQIGSDFAPSTGLATFNPAVSISVPATKTLTVRVFAWNAFSGTQTFRNRNMVISGTTCAVMAFSTQPVTQTLCAGNTLSLTAAASNATSYQWKKGGVNISGATSATYTKSNMTTADAGSYTVDGINACGVVNSNAAVITVNPSPTGVTATPSAAVVCLGSTINLTAAAAPNSNTPVTLLTEDFNGGTNPWIKINNSTGGTPANAAWTLRPDNYAYTANSSPITFSSNDNTQFYLSNSDAPGTGTTTATILQSPTFSTVGMTSANLTFYHYYRYWNGNESGNVEISTNGGANWTSLAAYASNQGASTNFALVTIPLASYLNQATVSIRFRYAATYDYYWAIDNVAVAGISNATATYAWTSTPAGFTSSLQNPTNVVPTVNTIYNVTVTNSFGCAVNASTASVTVNPASVGGTIAGSASVCATSNSGTLTLSGHTGTVTRWERSLDNFSTAPTIIANTTTTLTYNNLAVTTYYRAVVTSGVCASANSAVATVTVSPASVGGTVAGSATVCATSNSGTLTLSGNTGLVSGWESSLDNFATSPTTIVNTTTSLNYSNLTATTYFRAVVSSGACASANSTVAVITVNPASVGGSIAGSAAVCATANSGSLTLSGFTGTVTRWESSLDNFATAPTTIANTTATLNYNNLTATTYYRAVVTSGLCASANSSVATITINTASVGGSISGSDTVCGASNSGTLFLSGFTGTVSGWESSLDNFATAGTPIANTTTILNYSNLTATTSFRAIVTNGICSATTSSIATITVGSATTWNGAVWTNGIPTSASAVTFAGNFTAMADLYACSVTVTGNKSVVISSGHNITIGGSLTVEAGSSFTLENNANLLQLSNVANSGNIVVNRNSSALKRQDYTLWSSPVDGQNLLAFSPLTVVTPTSRFYTYNTATNLYGSIASPSTTDFGTGSGYLIRMPNNHPATTPTVWNGQFTGVPHNGDVNVALVNNGAGQRFNLIGNPYPSTVDLFEFIGDNAGNITGTLYFWRKTNNELSPSYCSWNTAGFVDNGEAQVVDPQDVLQTAQGFFVEAAGNATTVQFNNSQRIGDNAGQFFRSANEIEKHRIWLNASNDAGAYSQMLVSYMTGATAGIDLNIDGTYNNDGPIALNSIIEGADFVIQGRPLPFDAIDTVPLSFKTNAAGNYTIAIDHVDGLFSGSQDIYLKDNMDGSTHDLKAAAYAFAAEAGTTTSRFELVFQNSLGVGHPTFNENNVIIYNHNGNLVVNSGNITMDNVKVFDIRGRLLVDKLDINASETTIHVGEANQVLIVKIASDANETVTKKVIN